MAIAAPVIDSYNGGGNSGNMSFPVNTGAADRDRLFFLQLGNQYWHTWYDILYAGQAPTGQLLGTVYHNSGHDPAMHYIYYWKESDLAAGSNTLEWKHSYYDPNSHWSWILLTGVFQTDPFCPNPDTQGARGESFNRNIGSTTSDNAENALCLIFGMAHGYGWTLTVPGPTNSHRLINTYSGLLGYAEDGGDWTNYQGYSGGYPPNSGVMGWGIQPPQEITVDLSGQAVSVATSGLIGTVDDGNVTVNVSTPAIITASGASPTIHITLPITADMHLYS